MYMLAIRSIEEEWTSYFGPFISEDSARKFFTEKLNSGLYTFFVVKVFQPSHAGIKEFEKG